MVPNYIFTGYFLHFKQFIDFFRENAKHADMVIDMQLHQGISSIVRGEEFIEKISH